MPRGCDKRDVSSRIRGIRTSLGLIVATIGFALVGCGPKAVTVEAPPPPQVDVAKPLVQEIIEWDEYTGRLAAMESVDVRARISGYLDSIHFKDGQLVNKGDLLFVIDPRPFKAALAVAEAEATQAASRLELAKNDLERAKGLVENKAISREVYDTRAKNVDSASATLMAAKARSEQARLDLEFTEVRAPMSGRIGRHGISIGNVVSGGNPDSTLLANIVSVDSIYCYFDVSEQAYLKYLRLDKAGRRGDLRKEQSEVQVALLDESDFTHVGRMDFVDNQIDAQTGTLRGRAVLDNAALNLLPGVFVKVRIPGSAKYSAVMVPDRAIVADQSDRFVFVVGEGNIVKQQRITPGRLHNGMRIVNFGLKGDETVVISGIQRTRAGTPVMPEKTTLVAQIAPADQPAPAQQVALRPTTQLSTTGGAQ